MLRGLRNLLPVLTLPTSRPLTIPRSQARSWDHSLETSPVFCKIVGGVSSPLLANIVLNHLDWRLHEAGFRFARYADDFVVVCQDRRQAQEALELGSARATRHDLGLSLSPEKTKITTYGKGYEFLGFFLSSRSRRMRDKSVQKFKAKVREH